MHNTGTSIKVSDEDAVQSHVSDTSPCSLPSKRPKTSIISEHDVSVFRDIEAEVDEASDIDFCALKAYPVKGFINQKYSQLYTDNNYCYMSHDAVS